ncbi:MAG: energy-coupling factor ABC transporter ATP-binding protein, partial [Eubacteriales bacterium]|nr:energy-coupling factor ABC transporter ATP-binding protein [Eubacteriales bacterium]
WSDFMIKFQNVSFSYHNDNAYGEIKHLNLVIPKGQVVLLTGPSGCGKSTILRLINGLAPHFYEGEVSGTVLVDGIEPKITALHELAPVVGSVFQNPRTQFYNVDTTGELAFACENLGMPAEEIRNRVEQTTKQFHITHLMDRNIFHLSGGQKQQIACASVDVAGPDIFLLDEPTANLDYQATQKLKEIISIWKEKGKTILIAEHRIAWVWELCDRLIILKNGEIQADLNRKAMKTPDSQTLIEEQLRTTDEKNPFLLSKTEPFERNILIKNFTYSYDKKTPLLNLESFSIPENQITALVGENGAGKTTFLHCMAGILRKYKAKIEENGRAVDAKKLWRRTFLVMQDVNHQLFTESVLDEVLISMPEKDEKKALEILEQVHMKKYAARHPMSLSGGQKQRVAIACAAASGRDILLFDEPTSGLDRYHMEQTAELFLELKKMGKTIVIVTHDSELIELCCDAVIPVGEVSYE